MIGIARRRIPLLNDDGRGVIDGYEYVDLGLPSGLKWATCNVGATTETDYGNYFQWGAGATRYQNTNQYYTGSTNSLPSQYDTATQIMGGGWRMPTKAECEELIDNTTLSKITIDNNIIWKLSRNIDGKEVYIYIPYAGIYASGTYLTGTDIWSSSKCNNNSAYYLYCSSLSNGNTLSNVSNQNVKIGCSVRGVHA